MEGWIKIHRKLIDSELWLKPCEWRIIWLHIIMSVSHRQTPKFDLGVGLFKYQDIADRCGTTYNQVRRCLEWLVSSQSVATRKTTRGIFIEVLNYTKYQVTNDDKATQEANQKPKGSQSEANLYNKKERIKNIKIKNKKNCITCYEPNGKHLPFCKS